MKPDMEARVAEIVDATLGWYRDNDNPGRFTCEIYTDSRDELCETSVKRILSSDCPMDEFYSIVDNAYWEAQAEEERDLISHIRKQLEDDPDCPSEDEIESWVYDHCEVIIPYDHYLQQDVCINLMLDTGDGNTDYALNSVYPCWHGEYGAPIDERASLLWLARQQGYTKRQLNNALRKKEYNGSAFLESVHEEVNNLSTHMACVVFCVAMTLEKAIEIQSLMALQDREGHHFDNRKNPYCGYLTIGMDACCGLFDPWNGGGSILEIKLEKDVRIPVRFLRSALPDGADYYGIGSVYGVSEDMWTDSLKAIHAPKTGPAAAALAG